MDISTLWTAQGLLSLVTLSAMETVLGIDNVVFLSILVGKLPRAQQPSARRLGLILALGTRILLLFSLSWVMGLTKPLFEVFGHAVSGRDLVLFGGGGFLIAKATREIHEKIESPFDEETPHVSGSSAFGWVLVQVAVLDVVFSLDSVVTAVGMANDLTIMITAMVIAMGVMLFFAGLIGDFVHNHPTMKMLALSFLILIGVMLVAEGSGQHISKGYIYFAMAFSFMVEVINLRLIKAQTHLPPAPKPPVDAPPPAEREPVRAE
jgi:predicted tellurium resistance membrane protein TerC